MDNLSDADLVRRVTDLACDADDLDAAVTARGWALASKLLGESFVGASNARDEVARLARPDPDERRGDFICTYTGVRFWPLDPRPEEVRAADMAHALSLKVRWAGHCSVLRTVGAHALHARAIVAAMFDMESRVGPFATFPRELRQAAIDHTLVHDNPEAYLPDVPRPVKAFLRGWYEIDEAVAVAIRHYFGLPPLSPEIEAVVQWADDASLNLEVDSLFSFQLRELKPFGIPTMVLPERLAELTRYYGPRSHGGDELTPDLVECELRAHFETILARKPADVVTAPTQRWRDVSITESCAPPEKYRNLLEEAGGP